MFNVNLRPNYIKILNASQEHSPPSFWIVFREKDRQLNVYTIFTRLTFPSYQANKNIKIRCLSKSDFLRICNEKSSSRNDKKKKG